MTAFETIVLILLAPALYILAYLAGRYNLLAALCQLIADKAEEFTKEAEHVDIDLDCNRSDTDRLHDDMVH